MNVFRPVRFQPIKAHLLFLLLASCSMPGFAQDLADADLQEVSRYRLSEAALAKYTAATRELAEIQADNPAACEDEEEADSLSALAAQIDAMPDARAALASAGMSSREYIVFGLAMFQAGMGAWAASQPGSELPTDLPMENVRFYQAHENEIQALSGMMPEDQCGDDDDDWDEGDQEEDFDPESDR